MPKVKRICFCQTKRLTIRVYEMDKKIEAMALDKRMYYAQAETMEQGKPLVDILLNFQEVVNVIAERYAVNADFLLNWVNPPLPKGRGFP